MKKDITVAVLAVQGAFIEHEMRLQQLGVSCIELRQKKDLEQHFDALVLPGGESTVQGKLLRELEMFDDLRERIKAGMPVFATCAGMILLAEHISNDEHVYFGTLPVTVQRNAYGRQLGSFFVEEGLSGIGKVPMTFIRAPYVEKAEAQVEVLAAVEDKIVAVRCQNQLAFAFHPELNDDMRLYEMFLNICRQA